MEVRRDKFGGRSGVFSGFGHGGKSVQGATLSRRADALEAIGADLEFAYTSSTL